MTLRFWDLELHLFFIGRRKSEWSDGTGVQRRGRRGEIDEHARAVGGTHRTNPQPRACWHGLFIKNSNSKPSEYVKLTR